MKVIVQNNLEVDSSTDFFDVGDIVLYEGVQSLVGVGVVEEYFGHLHGVCVALWSRKLGKFISPTLLLPETLIRIGRVEGWDG